MFFWYSVTVMLLLAMAMVVWFHRRNARIGVLEDTSDELLYKTRIAEIENDFSNGRLDETSLEVAKVEAARLLINSKSKYSTGSGEVTRSNRMLLVSNVALLPLLCLGVYLYTGSPPQVILPQTAQSDLSEQSLDQLLATAEKRLKENPDDVRGWRVVAPVYMRANRLDDAILAYRNVLRIEGPSTEILSLLGEVLVTKTDGRVGSEAFDLFKQAVALDARNSTASFFIGLRALQTGDRDRARSVWQAMIDGATGEEDWIEVMKQRVARLDEPSTTPENTEPSRSVLPDTVSQEQREMIEGMVSGLAERLVDDPSDKQGWARLVRAYMVLGKREDALAAVEQASQSHSDDTELMEALRNTVAEFENSAKTEGEQQ